MVLVSLWLSKVIYTSMLTSGMGGGFGGGFGGFGQ